MTKPRPPYTICDSLTVAAAALGWAEIARASGKSVAWLLKCADPDDDSHNLHLTSALAIDAALVRAAEPPVFAGLLALLADLAAGDRSLPYGHAAASPQRRLNAVVKEIGDLAGGFDAALADGALAPREADAVLREAREARVALDRLIEFFVTTRSGVSHSRGAGDDDGNDKRGAAPRRRQRT